MKNSQSGFTLIELMLAVTLGLIVVAAATQVYVVAIRTGSAQQASASILDSNVFGLQQVERSMRMAGLGMADAARINSECSGILIANSSLSACNWQVGAQNTPAKQGFIAATLLSGEGIAPNTSNSATSQITIQYRAPVNMRDCEGKLALGSRQAVIIAGDDVTTANSSTPPDPKLIDGQVIVERYFVKKNAKGVLELRCDAGRYVTQNIITDPSAPADAAITGVQSSVKDIGDDGSLVVEGIDDFQVMVGAKTNSGITYKKLQDFKNSGEGEIVALQLAILAKGAVMVPKGTVADNPSFVMFGDTITIKRGQDTNYLRRVYETNVMLRNSRGL